MFHESRTVAGDDLEIAYEVAGEGEPALLFVHGICGDRSIYSAQVDHFAGDRRVITVDLRGHGLSSRTESVSVEDFARDVEAVIRDSGVRAAIVCGHSMGAVVGLQVAAALPGIVRGVVLLDPALLFPAELRRAGLEQLAPALASPAWKQALQGYFRGTILLPDEPEAVLRPVEAGLDRAEQGVVESFFRTFFASDHADSLVAAPCPLLLVHGRAPADLARVVELRPDAMIGMVVGSGHWVMVSAADQANAMIDRFLEVVAADRPAAGSRGEPVRPAALSFPR